MERVMQVLSRRTKNNPVLIGEPGVGKTAVVEGLAQRAFRRGPADGVVGKDPRSAGSLERSELQIKVLFRGGNPRESCQFQKSSARPKSSAPRPVT